MEKSFSVIAEFLKVWGLLGLVVAARFVVTYQYLGAPPPKVSKIATGMKNGVYYFGRRYARLLPPTASRSRWSPPRNRWKTSTC